MLVCQVCLLLVQSSLVLNLWLQSFAKNAGLYGERVGALHFIGVDKAAADRIKSQLSVLQRSEISNPPSHGARIVSALNLRD
jgi:aspartate/tyrosine/aromatic aminotransferase